MHSRLCSSPCLSTYQLADPPKRLHTHSGDATRRVVTAGQTVHLPCPVERNEHVELFIDWAKDGTSLDDIDSRIRITSAGVLRIRNTAVDDTGFYVCRAINGFGSIEVGTNLIVLGEYSASSIRVLLEFYPSPVRQCCDISRAPLLRQCRSVRTTFGSCMQE